MAVRLLKNHHVDKKIFDMEARAIAKYVRVSPKKARQVIDLVRGVPVGRALKTLHFTPKSAALPIEKTLRSAIANLMNSDQGASLDADELIVKEAFVDMGFSFKRFRAASMGRAMKIKRRTCHITIVVSDK